MALGNEYRAGLGQHDNRVVRADCQEPNGSLLDALGGDAWRSVGVLILYFMVGRAFHEGAKSLAEVIVWLEEWDLRGLNKYGVRLSGPTVSRQCKVAKRLFGRVLCGGGIAELFRHDGNGHPFSGLSEFGENAWELTRKCLLAHRVIEESD